MTDRPGQLLFAGFDGITVPDDLAREISDGRIGGVILFARNVENPAQLGTLTASLHACAPEGLALLIAIDQEGGRVQRLREPWTEWPPMQDVGRADDPALTAAVARGLARELRDLGIGLDFAPCVDVHSNADNPIIGDRSFGPDPATVARHAASFIAAMQAEGVAACAKHFPGHGDTACDSHLELPRLDHDADRLRAIELPPFAAAIEAGVATIMTAHVAFPALDGECPATLSVEIMAMLRDELGYDGLVFSDDLEMKAVSDHFTPEELVTRSLAAGVDSLLVCRDPALRGEVLGHLEAAPPAQLARPLARMARLKAQYAGPRPTQGAAPYPEHRALAASLTRATG